MMRLRGISKTYPGVNALDGVDIDLFSGEVHGLVGENGAGKSTLLKIACGAVAASQGEVEVDGDSVDFSHPLAARAAGVIAVHQELTIIPALSALANVFLGQENRKWGFLRRREMLGTFASLCDQLGVKIDPRRLGGSLSIADQQSLEIMRSLVADAKVLIFDEPTAALGPAERQSLYEIVRRLRSRGVAVLFISHDLAEVLRLTNRITVLRDGKLVETRRTASWSKEALVKAMLGEMLVALTHRDLGHSTGREVLRAEDVNVPGKIHGVSIRVEGGEILGLAGLVGSGRSELLRAIAGVERNASGRLYVNGEKVDWPRRPQSALRHGIALAPEDRKAEGLCLSLPAYANVTLTAPWRASRFGVLRTTKEIEVAQPVAKRVALQAGALRRTARSLSGGNQQKLVLAKWLDANVRVLLVDEPTRGVDVGAKAELFAALGSLATSGVAIVLVSSELEEVVDHSDRILVLSRGRLIAELESRKSTEEQVLKLIFALEEDEENE
jgi:ABC-type sugar transport system ATPase subunit